jgi:hypothetical protein
MASERLPQWVIDQMAAAAQQTYDDLAHLPGQSADVTPGMTAFVNDVLSRVTSSCPHLATPAPMTVYAFHPGFLCSLCALQAATAVQSTVEDKTCDRCGRYVSTIDVVHVAQGPVTVVAGLCSRCSGELGG